MQYQVNPGKRFDLDNVWELVLKHLQHWPKNASDLGPEQRARYLNVIGVLVRRGANPKVLITDTASYTKLSAESIISSAFGEEFPEQVHVLQQELREQKAAVDRAGTKWRKRLTSLFKKVV